ncbi:MAG: hypothetical protein PHZ22_05470 [Bacteroidales bacterium]|nr:hypothetical protein [Bacteroidales bacterium]
MAKRTETGPDIILDKESPEEQEEGSLRFYTARRYSAKKTERLASESDKDKLEQIREKIGLTKKHWIDSRQFGDDNRPDEFKTYAYYENLERDNKDRVKEQWLIEELEEDMRDIIRYAKNIGVKLTRDRFPDIDDIYIRSSLKAKGWNERRSDVAGLAHLNEMEFIPYDDKVVRQKLEIHELVHNASKNKIFIDTNGGRRISRGLNLEKDGSPRFRYLNEALTELTAQKIIQEKHHTTRGGSYEMETEFTKALIHDIAERLNGKDTTALSNEEILKSSFFGDKIKSRNEMSIGSKFRLKIDNFKGNIKTKINQKMSAILSDATGFGIKFGKDYNPPTLPPEQRFTDEEILNYFQAGMFNGDRRCLNIIRNIYGKENMKALAHMGTDREKIADLAHSFGLDDLAYKMGGYIDKPKATQNNKENNIATMAG